MTWLGWIWLSLLVASVYWFAQICYYLVVAAKRLRKASYETSSLIGQLQNLPPEDSRKIEPTQPAQRAEILRDLRRRRKERKREAELRQRRLVDRIQKQMSEGGRSR